MANTHEDMRPQRDCPQSGVSSKRPCTSFTTFMMFLCVCMYQYNPNRGVGNTVRSTDLKDNDSNEPNYTDEHIQHVHRLGSGAGVTVTCFPPVDCTNRDVLPADASTSNSSTTNMTADAVRIPFSPGFRKSVWLTRLHSASSPLATVVEKPHQVHPQAMSRRLRRTVKIPVSTVPLHTVLAAALPVGLFFVVCTLFCHMVTHRGGPPQMPMQRKQTCRQHGDQSLWSMSSDLTPSKQTSKIV